MGLFSKIFDFVGDVFGEVVSWFVDIPDPPQYEDKSQGTLLNKESNLAQIPVVYGVRKVGGTRVFVETSGSDNEYLYICLVLCEGEIQAIGDVYINDTISTDSKFSGLVLIDKKLGTDTQTASTVLTPAPSWTTDHRLRGIAYLGLRFKWDRDVFGSIPDVTAVVSGKKVYDPRNGAMDKDTLSTWAVSTNPAVCLLDYLRNSRYGKGLPDSSFESGFTSFQSAADVCEYEVDEYSGSGNNIQLFNCNAVIDVSKNVIDNVKELLSGMQGLLTYSQGKYRLVVEDEIPAGFTPFNFNVDNILGGITINGERKRERFNRVIATFANPEKNWQQDQIEYPEAGSAEYTSLLAEDGGFELEKRASLPTITNQYQARNIANTILNKSRNGIRCSFLCTVEALQVDVGDIVSVTHPSPGWTAKPFRITGLSLQSDGNVGVTLLEHQDSSFAWYSGASVPDYPDTTLPDPFTIASVNESTISVASSEAINDNGSSTQRFSINWTEPTDSFITEYIVQLKKDGTADWNFESRTNAPPLLISGIESGASYNLRIKSVNAIGATSPWVEYVDEYDVLIAVTADNLTTTAGGGNTTYYQDAEPTGGDYTEGDLWFDTNDNNKIYRYSGASWVAASGNLINTTVSTGLSDISANAGTITNGTFQVGAGGVNIQSAASGSRITISSSKMEVYDGTTLRVKIGDLS
jgi:hypothetical protein